MSKKNLSVMLVIFIITIVLSFYGGMKYAQSKKTNFANRPVMQGNGNFANNKNRMAERANGGMFSGEIISKDASSITLKLRDGGSKIIFFSDSTEFMKMSTSTINDFNINDNIIASGTSNSDGSITATSIQLRPIGNMPVEVMPDNPPSPAVDQKLNNK